METYDQARSLLSNISFYHLHEIEKVLIEVFSLLKILTPTVLLSFDIINFFLNYSHSCLLGASGSTCI